MFVLFSAIWRTHDEGIITAGDFDKQSEREGVGWMTAAETIRQFYKMQGAKEMLKELRCEVDPTSQSLAKAVEHFLNHSISPEEEEYIDRIDSLRKKRSVSTAPISVV